MYKRTPALILITSLFFFTSVSYAEDSSIEALQAQVTEAHNKIKALEEENKELRETLASKEKEVIDYRAKLEQLEAEIESLKEE